MYIYRRRGGISKYLKEIWHRDMIDGIKSLYEKKDEICTWKRYKDVKSENLVMHLRNKRWYDELKNIWKEIKRIIEFLKRFGKDLKENWKEI